MRHQRLGEASKAFDESFEEEIQTLLEKTNASYIRYPAYCYRCKGTFRNPYGHKKAPEACLGCGVQFSKEMKCALPDFRIAERYYDTRHSRSELAVGFIFVHGTIHFKDEAHRMHDYHQYVELLANDYKPFVILNETIRTMVWSLRVSWLDAVKKALVNDDEYVRMYKEEKELGLLQKAVLEHYANKR